MQLYGKVVMDVPGEVFEDALREVVFAAGGSDETDLKVSELPR